MLFLSENGMFVSDDRSDRHLDNQNCRKREKKNVKTVKVRPWNVNTVFNCCE